MSTAPSLTFEKDDKLSLKGFAEDLEAYVEAERHFVAGSLVLSLNAPFGFGKTTFLHMWRNSLLERRCADKTLPIPIMISTWESDHFKDPLIAIISALTRQLIECDVSEAEVLQIREAAKDIAWFTVGLANSAVSSLTGVDAVAAGEFAEAKKIARATTKPAQHNLLDAFEKRTASLGALRVRLNELFGSNKTRAIVMVDELDRCRPDYAVEFLETIKHIFSAEGVTFILAVDKSQLCSSVRAIFGHELNFDEYYRKFAHRNISLPSITQDSAHNLIKHYWDRVVINNEQRPKTHSSAVFNDSAAISLREVASCLMLGPRQIHEMLRIYGHVMARKNEKKGDLYWGYNAITAFMAGLSVGIPALYHKIGNSKATFEDVRQHLAGLLYDAEHGEWWIGFLGNARAYTVSSYDELLSQAKSVGLLAKIEKAEDLKQKFSEFASAWGHRSEAPCPYVYKIIERLRRFENPPNQ